MDHRLGILGCTVCRFGTCQGGHLKACLKRDPKPSRAAGILDIWGGLRFVVAHKQTFKHHVLPDELLFVVPKFLIHEPVGWNEIPRVIEAIERYVAQWIEKNRPNDPVAIHSIKLYQLRRLEHERASHNIWDMVET